MPEYSNEARRFLYELIWTEDKIVRDCLEVELDDEGPDTATRPDGSYVQVVSAGYRVTYLHLTEEYRRRRRAIGDFYVAKIEFAWKPLAL